MRNSLLVEHSGAENLTGLKYRAEVTDPFIWMVEEHSIGLRRCTARYAGGIGRENVGMSNEKAGEKPARRKPKVSRGRLIRSG